MKVISILLRDAITFNAPGFTLGTANTIGPAKHATIDKSIHPQGVMLSSGGKSILIPYQNILYIQIEGQADGSKTSK